MNDLELDSSHDLVIENSDLKLLNREELVSKQVVKIRLLKIRGEWWLDLRDGLPYLQTILQKGTSKNFVDTLIKQEVRNSYGVIEITNLTSEITRDRVYHITDLSFLSEDGEIVSITNFNLGV